MLAKLYSSIGSDTEMARLPIARKKPSWATAVKWAVTHANREVATGRSSARSRSDDRLDRSQGGLACAFRPLAACALRVAVGSCFKRHSLGLVPDQRRKARVNDPMLA